MRAIVVAEDRSLHWREVPDPEPRADEVLLDIRAAGVNRADLMQRAGDYPPPPGAPEWMGLEAAGVVAAVGPEAGGRWRVGDRVCALLGGGGYAEKVAVAPGQLLPVPDGLDWAGAAAIPEAFATAWLNLKVEAGLQAGEWLLVQAATSGVGLAALQLAKFRGAHAVAVVGSAAKADVARAFGADVVVNRHAEDLGAVLERHPVDVALDCVGGPALGRHLATLKRGGRWVLIANLAGAETELPLRAVLFKGLRLIGSTLRSRTPETKARLLADMAEALWPAFADGRLKPVVHATLPIARAEAAHAILERNENIGKVILMLPDAERR